MTRSNFSTRVSVLAILALGLSVAGFAQEIRQDRSRMGLTAGLLTYTGRYSVGNSLMNHTSWGASVFYVPNIQTVRNLDMKLELTGGRLRGDNNEVETTGVKGDFSANLVELAAKAEYTFIDLDKRKFSPYLSGGPGFYYLMNYQSSLGGKENADLMGFVLPVGGGVKYKVKPRLMLLLDGNVRFFNKNLDNVVTQTGNNPNKYFNVGLGLSYDLGKRNILW